MWTVYFWSSLTFSWDISQKPTRDKIQITLKFWIYVRANTGLRGKMSTSSYLNGFSLSIRRCVMITETSWWSSNKVLERVRKVWLEAEIYIKLKCFLSAWLFKICSNDHRSWVFCWTTTTTTLSCFTSLNSCFRFWKILEMLHKVYHANFCQKHIVYECNEQSNKTK